MIKKTNKTIASHIIFGHTYYL